jgi:hypothetical protein
VRVWRRGRERVANEWWPMQAPSRMNPCRAMGFMRDGPSSGRRYRIVNLIDVRLPLAESCALGVHATTTAESQSCDPICQGTLRPQRALAVGRT